MNHFLDKYNKLYNKKFYQFSPEIINRMVSFEWPGNIRQLENMVKQVVVREEESIITDLIASARNQGITINAAQPQTVGNPQPVAVNSDPDDFSLKNRVGKTVAQEEKRLIAEVLNKTNWNRRKAADLLEISYRSLLYKIKDYNLNAAK